MTNTDDAALVKAADRCLSGDGTFEDGRTLARALKVRLAGEVDMTVGGVAWQLARFARLYNCRPRSDTAIQNGPGSWVDEARTTLAGLGVAEKWLGLPAPSPTTPAPEIAEIEKRHAADDRLYSHAAIPDEGYVLAHQDRATLLAYIRTQQADSCSPRRTAAPGFEGEEVSLPPVEPAGEIETIIQKLGNTNDWLHTEYPNTSAHHRDNITKAIIALRTRSAAIPGEGMVDIDAAAEVIIDFVGADPSGNGQELSYARSAIKALISSGIIHAMPGREAMRAVIYKWIKDHTPLAAKMVWKPEQTEALLDALLAFLGRPGVGK